MTRSHKPAISLGKLVENDLGLVSRALISCGLHIDENWILKSTGNGAAELTSRIHPEQPELPWIDNFHFSPALYYLSKEYLLAERTRNYAFRLRDGALLQINYLFNGEDLVSQRLAYLQCPVIRSELDFQSVMTGERRFVELPDEEHQELEMFEEKDDHGLISIRFDYDPARGVELAHPKTHFTILNCRSCRIPVSSPMTAKQFVEMIVHHFYHDKIDELRNCFKASNARFMERIYNETFFPKEKIAFRVHTSS